MADNSTPIKNSMPVKDSTPTGKRKPRYRRKNRKPRPVEEKRLLVEEKLPVESKKNKPSEVVRQEVKENVVAGGENGGAKPKRSRYRKKQEKPPRQQKEQVEPNQQPKRQPVREEKRQIPALNFVSSVRPKINLIQYHPPPYLSLPPFRCDQTKMTLVKLRNIDPGVDERGSLLFWAFKRYGWIENVYVVRKSFVDHKTGVAFVGFRSKKSAVQAISDTGREQLFGRRIFVDPYFPREKKSYMRILQLPPNVLSTVFTYLDWRSRVRMEAVCKKFQNALSKLYEPESVYGASEKPKQVWSGLPDKIGFVFVAESIQEEPEQASASAVDSVFKVRVPDQVTDSNSILRNILRKFSTKINFLGFHSVIFDSETISMLKSGGTYLQMIQSKPWDAGRILMKDCMLNDVGCDEFADFMSQYGERLSIQD